jgi:Flp pilus assembly protein TadG
MILRRARDRSRGQALVEFALAIPIVLLLMLGILDLGRAVFAYNSVSNAARTGARVAIVNQDFTAVEAAALAEAVGLSPVVVEPLSYPYAGSEPCPDLDCVVRVEVTHDWTAATPIISQIVGPITMSSTSELPVERVSP